MTGKSLLQRLRRDFAAAGSPERAPAMQAYMKTAMPFHGVAAAPTREICREAFRELDLTSPDYWRRLVLAVWRGAKFREEKYAALQLAADRRAQPFQRFDTLPMYEELITSGAWWDLVDGIATRRLGEILRNDRKQMDRAMRAWSVSDDIWLRRSSILAQLNLKEETDLDLLYSCIEPSIQSREFFLRKAIGWALRHYARTNPDEVRRYVAANRVRMSPLSVREAMKHL